MAWVIASIPLWLLGLLGISAFCAGCVELSRDEEDRHTIPAMLLALAFAAVFFAIAAKVVS